MNVLYYLREFPKISESFVLNEIYALERRGHNVAVFALDGGDDPFTHDEFRELDIPVAYGELPSYTDALEVVSPKTITPAISEAISTDIPPRLNVANVFWAKQCLDFVDDLGWELDHVHSHFATQYMFPGRYVASYHDVPYTITTHAYDLYRQPIGEYTDSLLEAADRILTISEYNERYIRDQFAPDTPIDVVHAGIRTDKFAPTESAEDDRILSVCRLDEKKGLRYAIDAVALVAEERPDVEYHIVGSGDQYDDLVQRIERLGIERNVTFLDNVPDERLIAEYDRARCFLLPSVVTEHGERDGIPVALMEAMSMRTPPVSTTISGIPELVDHGSNGLLAEPRDPETTAELVLQLLDDEATWEDFARRARETVLEEFEIANVVEDLVDSFDAARSYGRPTSSGIGAIRTTETE